MPLYAPKPQRRWATDALIVDGHGAEASSRRPPTAPTYSFPAQELDELPIGRASSRAERKRTTSNFSARSSHRSAAPPYAALEPTHPTTHDAWPRRTKSRQSSRPARPASPVYSDISTTSTVYHRRNAGTRSIAAVLAEDAGAPPPPPTRKYDSMAKRWVRWMHKTGKKRWTIPSLVVAVLLVKTTVGFGAYSGMGDPPLYGDYEAQRHWMSLTWHLPVSDWYFHDPEYWRLDYPPLTAYHSYALAWIAAALGRERWIGLRGVTDVATEQETKLFMRSTVLLTELLLWVPLVIFGWTKVVLGGQGSQRPRRSERTKAVAVATLLFQPGLILIDNGHFQYNSVMLALTLLSVVLFHLDRDLSGAAAFVLAMSFKQMSIYYAPAMFAYLFGKCLFLGSQGGLTLFVNLAFISVTTLIAAFAPFLSPVQLVQALQRIFPFARGLWEDKVANVWCALNTLIKLRQLASIPTLMRLALGATTLALLPSMIGQIWVSWQLSPGSQPRKRGACPPTLEILPYTLFVSSMAFFLFSFQVHEKSILIPLLPVTMLMAVSEPGQAGGDWEWGVLLNNVAMFSMWPLLRRDGQSTAYAALMLLWNHMVGNDPFALPSSFVKVLSISTYAVMAAIHILEAVAKPPDHLPDLFVVLNMTMSAGIFGLAYLWGLKRQLEESYALIGLSSDATAVSASIVSSRAPSRVASPTLSQYRAMSPAPQVVGRQQAPRDEPLEDVNVRRRTAAPSERSRSAAGWDHDLGRSRQFSRTDHQRPQSRMR